MFHWRWHYHVPSLAVWGLIGLLLVVPKANRDRRAWLILVPLVVVMLVWRMPFRLTPLDPGDVEMFGSFLMCLAMGLTAVWLLGHRLAGLHWFGKLLSTLTVMAATGLLWYLSSYGLGFADELAALMVYCGVSVFALSMAMGLAGLCCRGRYHPARFMGWLALWIVLMPMAVIAVIGTVVAVATGDVGNVAGFLVMAVLTVPVVLGGMLYLLNLPFMLLAFNVPFYGARLRSALDLDRPVKGRRTVTPFMPDELTIPTEPTTGAVRLDDVLGRWQFYLDEESTTVIMDFRPEGTFAQTTVTNRGEATEHVGGTWSLDGAMIYLSGYTAVKSGSSASRTWWMMDTPSGLAVFGGDGVEPDSFFRMTRGPRSIEMAAKYGR